MPAFRLRKLRHFPLERMARPEGMFGPIATGIEREDLFEDAQIVRDGEGIPRILVAEQEVEIVEAGPGDRRKAERAWLVGGEKDAVLRVRTVGLREFVEALQRMHLAVPERVFQFIVRLGNDDRQ